MESGAPPSRAALIHTGRGRREPKGCTQGVDLPGRPPWGHPRRGPRPSAPRGRPKCTPHPAPGPALPLSQSPHTRLPPGHVDWEGSDPEQACSQSRLAPHPSGGPGKQPWMVSSAHVGVCQCDFTSPRREAWGDLRRALTDQASGRRRGGMRVAPGERPQTSWQSRSGHSVLRAREGCPATPGASEGSVQLPPELPGQRGAPRLHAAPLPAPVLLRGCPPRFLSADSQCWAGLGDRKSVV